MAPRTMGAKPSPHGAPNMSMHSAGIFADMAVDGPEIGTLVIVVDRAKNLPNLRTMGKQDPYCAARLGKNAKKTETDKRGGQTPRWDQELRFTVHDSPDYHQLKVSVFNDDKRTDLIGECWVSIEDLLRPGGGQSDAWHHLNVKGRYAGEIRIELTFYDSRPKPEKPRKTSNAAAMQADVSARPLGGRQPIGRRPLPETSGTPPAHFSPRNAPMDQSPALPTPPGPPRSYPTPPRQHAYSDSYANEPYAQDHYPQSQYDDGPQDLSQSLPRLPNGNQQAFDGQDYHQNHHQYADIDWDLPGSEGHGSHYDDFQHQQGGYDMYYASDPNALQALEDRAQADEPKFSSPAQHYAPQVQARRPENTPRGRPAPPAPVPHSHSAPQLHPRHQPPPQQYDEPTFERQDSYYDQPQEVDDYYHTPDQSYSHSGLQNGYSSSPPNHLPSPYPPPPPPAHRNSAPVVPRSQIRLPPVQHSTAPSRALHVSTNAADLPGNTSRPSGYGASPVAAPYLQSPSTPTYIHQPRPGYRSPTKQHSADDYPTQYPEAKPAYPAHLAQNADPRIQSRDELAYDPRQPYAYAAGAGDVQDRPQPLTAQRPHPLSRAGHTHSSPAVPMQEQRTPYRESPPVAKPQTVSPAARGPASSYATPRKSVSPRPSPEPSAANAYSPDSFGALNPHHSARTTPSYLQSREPTPMYTPPHSSRGPEEHSPSPDPLINPDGTVTTSDGRTKDASDHLPPSSYAAEPEPKGADKNRSSTRINIQNRFGPREVSSASPTTPRGGLAMPSAEQRDRLYRRAGGGSGSGSPLSPAQPNTLNFNPGAPNQTSPYPPPVPGKMPLQHGRQNSLEDYEPGGDMNSLAADLKMVSFKGDDERIEKMKTNGAGRLRKSKWSG